MEDKKTTVTPEPLATEQERFQAVEAILFAAGHPMRYEKIAEALGLTAKEVKSITRQLAEHLEHADTIHGIQLLCFPTTCQLATKEQYAPYIREALDIRRGGNLSASSMEVLAVVAYNQPVTRSFVDLVRGVDSSYAVNSLLDKGLIEAAGRLDAPGRPMLYVTTDKFLRVFGIHSLDELPETEALSVAASQVEEASTEEAIKEEATPADYAPAKDSEETDVIYEAGVEALPASQNEKSDRTEEL